ncbi:hypothetical protein BWI96_10425 [Siphonobacter sp. SORGH_AS_0500]|uniref:SusC/RagA family TonB-linked outer membrane protein n=1 Tax=Siphonobacter sp. SORGH_AS_0500 TaxID=1864824 RepID=UPI000CBA2FE5|nr:SusC/RagA family TonB-linked outer membrane protein [Siphonobacter sp. SORGH_AS_0500]PKK36777.1 hypothetical protein BWI96_10425 [Siphonobacter sp. SORGH_AS_0500]
MKRLLCFLIGSCLLSVPVLSSAQVHHAQLGLGYQHEPAQDEIAQKKISIHFSNTSLETALQAIAEKSGIGIYYNPHLLPRKSVSIRLADIALQQAFELLLKDTPLEAIFRGGDVILKEKPKHSPAKTTSKTQLQQKEITVTGVVTDAITGEALPGVHVLIKGTYKATVTDSKGRYSLAVPSPEAILIFSYIGMDTQEHSLGNQSVLDVKLRSSIKGLNEVVVIGYGTQLRKDLTGSIGSVSEKALRQVPITGMDQALQGRVAGVQVTQTSGQPGGSVNIRIRGTSSITAGNEPLYVIDGVPFYNWGTTNNNGPAGIFGTGVVHNALSAINPNDIVSMEVLKDAAAASIYGSRAANGVVLITTKRGKAGQARVELDAYYGIQSVAHQLPTLHSSQYAELINESRANARADLGNPASVPVAARPIPELADPSSLITSTNWQDQIFKKAAIQNYQLSISGGNEFTQYALSLGYFNQDGIIKVSGYKRYSVRLNLDQQVFKKFKIGSSITVNNATNTINRATGNELQGGLIYGALLQTPTIPVYDASGNYARPNYTSGFALIDNPLASALEYWHPINTTRMIGSSYAEYTFLPGFTLRTSIGLDANYLKNNIFIPTSTGTPPPSVGSGFAFASQELGWLNENILSYSKHFHADHHLSLVGGATFQGANFERMISRVTNFPNDLVTTTNGGQTDLTNSFREGWRMASFLARAHYAFRSKYLFSVAMRADGSSKFGPQKRFGYFPSISAGWNISEEPFLVNHRWLNDLKIRVSYGLTGNSEIQNGVNSLAYYAYIGSVATANYAFGGKAVNGLAPNILANARLGWESTAQFDVGLDVGLFNNRLNLVTDVYVKNTNQMLVSGTPLAYTTGFSGSTQNIGGMQNKGWEFAINSVNLPGAFRWTTSLNAALNKNHVVSLGQADRQIILSSNTLIRAGLPVSSFYGYVMEGIFQSAQEIEASPVQPFAKPGDLKFKDVNGDGVINDDDRTIIGNPTPDWVYGMTNAFSYKGVELNIFFQGVQGNQIYNVTRQKRESMLGQYNGSTQTLHRWHSASDPGDGKTPRAVAIDRNNNNRFSTRWIEDGSFLRLRNISLGYQWPAKLLNKWHLKGLKTYVSAQNLITFTSYSGYDPEVGRSGNDPLVSGYDDANYPLQRMFMFGLNLSL